MTLSRTWAYAAAVALPNVAIYWRHYFGAAGIPWDFPMSYYAMVAFWTSLVREGILPHWMPFQQMGFPFSLQPQSGIHYLPNWIFPLIDQPYTLRAAIVLQCLHVLAGGYGMFVLARHLRRSNGEALVAAVAFQCFGGFFSNAEHVDIVRAYAFTPWLLFVFTMDVAPGSAPATALAGDSIGGGARQPLPWRTLAIAPVLYLFLTGAYPGNVFAAALVIAAYVLLQAVQALGGGMPAVARLRSLRAVSAMTALGGGMALLHLGPVALFSHEFVRSQPLAAAARESLWLPHLPGLFLSNAALPGEISMTSAFVTLPVVVLCFFVPLAGWRRQWVWTVLGLLAVTMIVDTHFPPGMWLRQAIPPLGLSRFPSSDYRAWVAVPLVLLALEGLRALVCRVLPAASFLARVALCAAVIGWGVWRVYPDLSGDALLALASGTAALSTVAGLAWWRPQAATLPVVAIVIGLVSVDAFRVLPAIPGWNEPDMEGYYVYTGAPPATRNRGRRLAAEYIPANLPSRRPARVKPAGLVRWGGYITGTFHANDLTPNLLRRAYVVDTSAVLQAFMLREWMPVLVDPPAGVTMTGAAAVDETTLAEAMAMSGDRSAVTQTKYGINTISYEVALKEPRMLVENEVYFPGWTARTSVPGSHPIQAIEVNGVFRGWMLPAGRYSLTASFELPHLWGMRMVSAASGLLWLAVMAWRATPAQSARAAAPITR